MNNEWIKHDRSVFCSVPVNAIVTISCVIEDGTNNIGFYATIEYKIPAPLVDWKFVDQYYIEKIVDCIEECGAYGIFLTHDFSPRILKRCEEEDEVK